MDGENGFYGLRRSDPVVSLMDILHRFMNLETKEEEVIRKNGKKDKAVERITVAGNFFQMLKNIRAVGSDLFFPGSSTGSPSVDVGTLQVSGK